mgnify:CR=1 FL=1
MGRRDIVAGVAGLLMATVAAAGLAGWYGEHRRAAELAAQVTALREEAKRSAVVQNISRQMEEIAREQKDISDEQREEAIEQRRRAEAMRLRSEVERQHALAAQQQAVTSEALAQDARQMAEHQRLQAEHQRIQAELSKRVADTLSYLALARSLGSLATIQQQSGDTELAALLAYASYLYTTRYGGNVYYPAVFQPLTQTSQSQKTWAVHTGAVTCIANMPKGDDRLVTASTYGELKIHQKTASDRLESRTLLSDNSHDFRDIYVSQAGIIYAVSRNGHLVIAAPSDGTPKTLALEQVPHPFALSPLNDRQLLVVGENDMAVVDMEKNTLAARRHIDYKACAVSRTRNKPLVFDNHGRMYIVTSADDQETLTVPVTGQVTAFAESKGTGMSAYGMSDGIVYLVAADGQVSRLVGHRSRISRLKLNGRRLYSSSYDGTVNQWVTDGEKIDPVTLTTTGQWVMNFAFDNYKETLWVGDWAGNLSMTLLNVKAMAIRLKSQLKRDFTKDEWTYYIGKNVPYESFTK